MAAFRHVLFLIITPLCYADNLGVARISVSPSSVTSDTWVTVSFRDVPQSELDRPSTEYICKQDSFCKEVQQMSLWVGMFGKGADRTPIGPQLWDCANPPWLATSPIKWKPLYASSGTASFHILAGRHQKVEFVLFSNGTTWPIELASSNVLSIQDAQAPRHIRLARTASPTEMRITWSTLEADTWPEVRWGFESNNYTFSSVGSSSTYQKTDLCGPPAITHGWVPAPWSHSVVLSSLPAAPVRIYYIVGSNRTGWTKESSFFVPEAAAADATLRFLALADVGETYIDGAQYHWMEPFAVNTTSFALGHWDTPGLTNLALNPLGSGGTSLSGKEGAPKGKVLTKMRAFAESTAFSNPTTLVLHIGDLAYATGYEHEWDYFMTQIEPLASRAPYMTTEGNHERDYPGSGSAFGGGDSGGECGIPTEHRFVMPTPGSVRSAGWYSFDQGPVHFIAFASEMSAYSDSDQIAFLKTDLAAVDRTKTPWVIVYGHRPMYSSTSNPKGFDLADGPWWPDVEEVFVKYKVDLCLWGHVHNAEVTCPLINGTCVEAKPGEYDAPVHAVIGNGGQSLTPFCIDHSNECCCSADGPTCKEACDKIPPWSLWRMSSFGFAQLEVQGATRLTMNFYIDCDGEHNGPTLRQCKKYNELVHTFTIDRSVQSKAAVVV